MAEAAPHIVQVSADLNLGGSQMVAVELAEASRAAGYQATVIAAAGPLQARIKAVGARHLDWPVGKKKLRTLGLIKRLRQWLLDEQVDLIHAHSRLPAWLVYRALKKIPADIRPRFVTTMHGHYSVSPYSAVMAKGDAVIAVSEFIRRYTLDSYPQTPSDQLTVIYGGASEKDCPYNYQPDSDWWPAVLRQFPELEGKTLLCLPSRLSRTKGHLQYLDMFAQLAGQDPQLHTVFVGGGRAGSSYHKKIESRIEANHLQGRVTHTGPRQDVRDWMAASAIVFNLSDDPPEAFGRTVLEALRLGRPVIAWNHGGAAEILARMFPQGAVEPGNMTAMAERAREFLQQPPTVPDTSAFSLRSSMQKHLELYQSLIRP